MNTEVNVPFRAVSSGLAQLMWKDAFGAFSRFNISMVWNSTFSPVPVSLFLSGRVPGVNPCPLSFIRMSNPLETWVMSMVIVFSFASMSGEKACFNAFSTGI